MISRIKIEGFRCFKSVELKLGAFNLLVGANGTGKSSVLEAMRVIQGVGRGLTVGEILNGKVGDVYEAKWSGILGGGAMAGFGRLREGEGEMSVIEATIEEQGKTFIYRIGFDGARGRVMQESLTMGSRPIFDSRACRQANNGPVLRVRYNWGKIGRAHRMQFEVGRPVLGQLAEHGECSREHRKWIEICMQAMQEIELVDPAPVMRIPRMPEDVRLLTEMVKRMEGGELEDVAGMEDAEGEIVLMAIKGKREFPAEVLSEGARRYLAVLMDVMEGPIGGTILVRGIDKSVSPLRMKRLMEEIRTYASSVNGQVILTAHSPIVLSWVDEADYPTTFLCTRDEKSGSAEIRSLDQSDEFAELVKRHPLSNLFAEEWLEGMM